MKQSESQIENNNTFDESKAIQVIKHYLPSQAPLKDFIFQNNLEAFITKNFFEGLDQASKIFGYKVFLTLADFRELYKNGKINDAILDKIIKQHKGLNESIDWKTKVLFENYNESNHPLIGQLRSKWQKERGVNLNSIVHPLLFRMLCSYLDQGISIWNFPIWQEGFLLSIKEMESNSFTSFFKTERPRKLLLDGTYEINDLLKIIVGDESFFSQYLYDQQFIHQGWSGLVSIIEDNPTTLMDEKIISIKDIIIFELLLEIDALDSQMGLDWKPLCEKSVDPPIDLFANAPHTQLLDVYTIWQEAYEWTYYEEALAAIHINNKNQSIDTTSKSFQSMFCIDDRETSLRDNLERVDKKCETFATPGFFNVEFFFRPEHGKALTKLCPAPVTPKYLIKELNKKSTQKKAHHFSKETFSFSFSWVIVQLLALWSAFRLVLDVFKPRTSPSSVSSFNHMDKESTLTIENKDITDVDSGLQVGFTIDEMAIRVEGLLRSIGLISNFAPIVYVIGHGASSVNNPYYATMDCGACSCRPGSVNARAFSFMANHPKVRAILKKNGIQIPDVTNFIGGLHDTTRDDIIYFDENKISTSNHSKHKENQLTFLKALDLNAKERSRRFESIDSAMPLSKIHRKIRERSVSLFEPRPELDHANNALTIIGRRKLTKSLFFDKRAFMNSYDYKTDLDGTLLSSVLKPIAPVCGGINLSYYFSRVDNKKLGSGTKLPHNVMGLLGVANGIDGDLRHGLPNQMIESHDPLRHLVIVEHYPTVLLNLLKKLPTYNYYLNNWMHVIAIHPETAEMYKFKDGAFIPFKLIREVLTIVPDIAPFIETTDCKKSIPIYSISK
jgi:uncharacterized protein